MRRPVPLAGAALLIAALTSAGAASSLAGGCARRSGEPTVVDETTGRPDPGDSSRERADMPQRVVLDPVAEGLDQPLQALGSGDGSGRLFAVEKTGRIRVIRDGTVVAEPFLDLSGRVSEGSEQGLLCVAFAPSFARTGRFYVNYTDTSGDTVVARFTAEPGANVADRSSEEVLLRIDQPFANHNGGQLLFDRDGNLLIGTGDGGSAGDPRGNAQSRETLLGKILRIDVGEADEPGLAEPGASYRIPRDNPYARSRRFRREIWAYGLRNPWRFSLDPATGDLYIGDVGQQAWEEIDAVRGLGKGAENYGWNLLEGTHPYPPGAREPRGLGRFTMPVAEYGRDLGHSVTGGVVYRGSRYPALAGVYLYADFVSGRVWGLAGALDTPITRQLADTGYGIASFGYGDDGEVYIADLGGRILRVGLP